MKKAIKPYFNKLQELYHGNQPCFYDVKEIDGISALEKGCEVIYQELMANLSDERKRKICFDKISLKNQDGWQQIELKIYGVEYHKRISLFPKTMKILNDIEGLSTIYFSLLAPHSRIEAHVGDTDALYRIHLGLKIPAALPACGIEVAGYQKSWETAKCLAFNDIYYHSVWNETDEERVVLIVDIIRPEFRHKDIYVNSGVRAVLYHARIYEMCWPVIELMPRILTRLIFPVFHTISYGWHGIRHKLLDIKKLRGLHE